MSDFLDRQIGLARGAGPRIEPRLPFRFEAQPEAESGFAEPAADAPDHDPAKPRIDAAIVPPSPEREALEDGPAVAVAVAETVPPSATPTHHPDAPDAANVADERTVRAVELARVPADVTPAEPHGSTAESPTIDTPQADMPPVSTPQAPRSYRRSPPISGPTGAASGLSAAPSSAAKPQSAAPAAERVSQPAPVRAVPEPASPGLPAATWRPPTPVDPSPSPWHEPSRMAKDAQDAQDAIQIDRLEIVVQPPSAPAPPPSRTRRMPLLSLDAYLARRADTSR